jgi:hypothetical protein
MENNIDSSRLENDPDLIPLLSKGATLLACLCFAHWIRGFEPTDIGLFFKLSEEEVGINIAHVKQLLPSEILASQIQIRDEIKAIQKRSEERKQESSKGSALSVEDLMERGQNPAYLLRKLREEINENISIQVEELRFRDGTHNIHERADDGSLENDLSRISKLRMKTDSETGKSGRPLGNETRKSNDDKAISNDRKKNLKVKRITIRIDTIILEELQKHIHNADLDVSKAVREAIVQYLEAYSID